MEPLLLVTPNQPILQRARGELKFNLGRCQIERNRGVVSIIICQGGGSASRQILCPSVRPIYHCIATARDTHDGIVQPLHQRSHFPPRLLSLPFHFPQLPFQLPYPGVLLLLVRANTRQDRDQVFNLGDLDDEITGQFTLRGGECAGTVGTKGARVRRVGVFRSRLEGAGRRGEGEGVAGNRIRSDEGMALREVASRGVKLSR